MKKKYELTDETIKLFKITLYRIKALVSFGPVKAGDLGGWIEKEENLSHDGNAWVFDNAWVTKNARISGNARVYSNAWVSGDAQISDDALISGYARINGSARVYGNAMISGDAHITDEAQVYGNVRIFCNAVVSRNANIGSNESVLWMSCIGLYDETTTFFYCEDKKIRVNCTDRRMSHLYEIVSGDLHEFAEEVKEAYKGRRHAKAYMLAIELAKIKIKG